MRCGRARRTLRPAWPTARSGCAAIPRSCSDGSAVPCASAPPSDDAAVRAPARPRPLRRRRSPPRGRGRGLSGRLRRRPCAARARLSPAPRTPPGQRCAVVALRTGRGVVGAGSGRVRVPPGPGSRPDRGASRLGASLPARRGGRRGRLARHDRRGGGAAARPRRRVGAGPRRSLARGPGGRPDRGDGPRAEPPAGRAVAVRCSRGARPHGHVGPAVGPAPRRALARHPGRPTAARHPRGRGAGDHGTHGRSVRRRGCAGGRSAG